MTPRCALFTGLLLTIPTPGCGSSGGNLYSLPVGDDGAVAPSPGSDATASGAFDAHIEQNHMVVTIVTLTCAGRCADVKAIAMGGQPDWRSPLSGPVARVRRRAAARERQARRGGDAPP